MSPRFSRAWLAAAGLLTTQALAQVAPDAGRILSESERAARRELPPVAPAAPAVTGSPARAARPQGDAARTVTIYVRRIVIPGGLALSQDEVDQAMEGRLGRNLNFIEIFDRLDIVSDLLKRKGYPFARVFLPEQRVAGADIHVRVYTGVVESIEAVPAKPNPRTSPEDVARRVGSALAPGQPFRTPDAERGLLLAADLVGRPVTGQLSPGNEVGTTKLTVGYEDVPLASWQVAADNYGNKFAGRERLSGDGRLRGMLLAGDLANFGLTLSQDLVGFRLGYQAPLGHSGWTAGLAYSDIHYALSGAFAGFEGDARELRITTAFPLVRTRASSTYLEAALASRDLSTVNGPFDLPRTVEAASLGLRSEFYDGALGGGVTTADLTLVFGDATAESFLDPANFRDATGNYSKLILNLSRLQRVNDLTTLLASLRVQMTGDNLDTSEQGSLGGPFGVRAYANEEATGDQYAILSLELRREITQTWSAKAFFDHGNVTITKDIYPGFSGEKSYSLQAVGLGAEWNGSLLGSSTVFSATLATGLGGNPGLNAQGLDSEGGTSDTRLWLSLTSRF